MAVLCSGEGGARHDATLEEEGTEGSSTASLHVGARAAMLARDAGAAAGVGAKAGGEGRWTAESTRAAAIAAGVDAAFAAEEAKVDAARPAAEAAAQVAAEVAAAKAAEEEAVLLQAHDALVRPASLSRFYPATLPLLSSYSSAAVPASASASASASPPRPLTRSGGSTRATWERAGNCSQRSTRR